MADERWTPEELAIQEAARAKPIPVRSRPEVLPCRRHIDNPVTAEEVDEFLRELEKK